MFARKILFLPNLGGGQVPESITKVMGRANVGDTDAAFRHVLDRFILLTSVTPVMPSLYTALAADTGGKYRVCLSVDSLRDVQTALLGVQQM